MSKSLLNHFCHCRNIYWSDIVQGNIKVATENGTYVKTIVSSTGRRRKPTSLAVNPARGSVTLVCFSTAQLCPENSYIIPSQNDDFSNFL